MPRPSPQLTISICIAGCFTALTEPIYSFGCKISQYEDAMLAPGNRSAVANDIHLSGRSTSSAENVLSALATPISIPPSGQKQHTVQTMVGQASWYGPGFFGKQTVSGEMLQPGAMTAAHRSLPIGTMVRVTNFSNGRSAVVRINDRGPYIGKRIIDLAHGAACKLGLVHSGITQVRIEVLR